jgi:hypothetical protein
MNLLLLLSSLQTLNTNAYTLPFQRRPTLTALQSTALSSTNNENLTTKDVLSLSSIRSTLIRQEETIIFALIERAQFRRNEKVYEVGGVPELGWPLGAVGKEEELSFLDWMFIGTVCDMFLLFIVYKYIYDFHCKLQ